MQADLRYELALRRSEALLAEARLDRLARDTKAARTARRGAATAPRSRAIASLTEALVRAIRRVSAGQTGATEGPVARMTECPEC